MTATSPLGGALNAQRVMSRLGRDDPHLSEIRAILSRTIPALHPRTRACQLLVTTANMRPDHDPTRVVRPDAIT